ncbi:MAG: hypothetical protein HY699_21975 [Deltaproteobacteria bacterium]|nr:hypothetical protein [Deltaproteobacteria bacterium]
MSRVETAEREVQSLSVQELAAFRKWFHEFDAAAWDRQIEEDVQAGKFDRLADAAQEAFKAGKCTEF